MRIPTMVLSIALALCLATVCVAAEPAENSTGKPAESAILVAAAPKWNVGDTWKFRTEKNMGRTVTQNVGIVQVTMTLNMVETETSYYVTGADTVEGEKCYVLGVSGSQKIHGTYSSKQVEGELLGGIVTQTSTFRGSEYRRASDLAFVKSTLHATGTIEIGGGLAGVPTPFESESVTLAKPPVRQLQFPLTTRATWPTASTVTITTSGTTSDTVTINYNYESKVLGPSIVTAGDDGKRYDSIAISQSGTQTTQSQNAGVSLEEIKGTLFYSPIVGNLVADEAEGEKLLEYTPADKAG